MTKLTDTQLVILSAAAQRPDRGIILPGHLKGGAARIVADRLIARGLIEEVRAAADLLVWRSSEDGSFALRITSAGLEAIGVGPDQAAGDESPTVPSGEGAEGGSDSAGESHDTVVAAAAAISPRSGSKQALVIEMLSRPEGASIEEIVAETGWQRHTVRGLISGALKKKLGLSIVSERAEGGRRYRIETPR